MSVGITKLRPGTVLSRWASCWRPSGTCRQRVDWPALAAITRHSWTPSNICKGHLSRSTALMLCLDDFQLSDPESFAGVRHLAAELAGHPIGWVLGVRSHVWPRELETTWMALKRQGVRHVRLEPLNPEAVHQIAQDHFGRPAGASLQPLLAQAAGNPGLLAAQPGASRKKASHPRRSRGTAPS